MNYQAIAFILLLGTMYGSNVLAARFAVSQFNSVTFTALRLSITFLVFFLFYLFRIGGRKIPTDKTLWMHSLLMGIFYDGLPITLFVSALPFLSAGVATTLFTLYPAMVALLAHFFLPDEQLNPRKAGGILLALGGAALMVLLGESGLPDIRRANPLGYFLILLTILISSAATIYVRKNLVKYDTFDVAAIRMFSAAGFFMIFAALWNGMEMNRVSTSGYLVLLMGGINSFFIALVNFFTIKRFGASKTSMADYFTLVVASLGGVILFGELFTPGIVIGMGCILGGVILLNTSPAASPKTGEVMQG